MSRIFAWCLLMSISTSAISGNFPALDPNISAVHSSGQFRLLVEDACSPEHCWHQIYIEWLSLDKFPKKVVKTVEVKELSGYFHFTDIRSEWEAGKPPKFSLTASPTHIAAEEAQALKITIQPKGVGVYELLR